MEKTGGVDVRLWRVRDGTSSNDQREQGKGDKDIDGHRERRR